MREDPVVRDQDPQERPKVTLVDADGSWVRLTLIDEDRAVICGGTTGPLAFQVRKAWQGTWAEASQEIARGDGPTGGITRMSPHDLTHSIVRELKFDTHAKPPGSAAMPPCIEKGGSRKAG